MFLSHIRNITERKQAEEIHPNLAWIRALDETDKVTLFQQSAERARALNALYTVTAAANQGLDLDAVLQTVIKELSALLQFDACRIFLLDADTNQLRRKLLSK